MPNKVPPDQLKMKKALAAKLDEEFNLWRPHFQEVAKYILPRQYRWLMSDRALSNPSPAPLNTYILDPTATNAVRVLTNGLMNGITSPARPWFRLRLKEFPEDIDQYPQDYLIWLEEAKRRMEIILAESNYYNAQAVQYLEMVGFGTGAMIVYEDFDDIIRCYNSPMGEYRLIQSNRRDIVGMARQLRMTVQQLVDEFGLKNVSEPVKIKYSAGGAGLLETVSVGHLIERNEGEGPFKIGSQFKYREIYWETNNSADGQLLRLAGFHESPIIAPRWELIGNDTYGTSPSMDALPDIKQLQLETKRKGQGLDKLVRPPILADAQLRGKGDALLPGGISYITGANSFGAKPIYTVNPPLGEMTRDIAELQQRIREHYYNHLFRNVSNLDTVRSAAEVYERKNEDMLMLGGVLERFQQEALDRVIRRTFNIMLRAELFPKIPDGLDPATIDIQYVSILADAQRAAGTASIERYFQVSGELGAINPETLSITNYSELLRDYAARLNVPAKGIRSREEVAQLQQEEKERLAAQQDALVGKELTDAAKNLSDTDVGGGQNALAAMLGG